MGTTIGGKDQFAPFLFFPALGPAKPQLGASQCHRRCPRMSRGEGGGPRAPGSSCLLTAVGAPVPILEGGSGRDTLCPHCPRTSLTLGRRAGFRVSVHLRPSSVLITHTYIRRRLRPLAALALGSPSPYLVRSRCQDGGVQVGLRLGDGCVFCSAQLVFIALPGATGRRGIWIFFQNSV